MSTFRLMLLGTAAVGLTAAAMSSASAGEVEKSLAASGHVNRTVVVGDDGKNNFVIHSDPGGISTSRFRLVASAKSESLSTGATIEAAANGNADGSQHATDGTTGVSPRHSYVWISNNMGKIRMGHTGHAGNGITGVDVSSTGNAGAMAGTPFGGVLTNNTTTTTLSAAGTAIGSLISDHTVGRTSGISYDTPDFNGFSATVSHINAGSGSFEVDYSADYDGVSVSVHGGWSTVAGDAVDERYGGGIGIGLANGLNVSINYGKDEVNTNAATGGTANREDPTSWWGKIGYDMNASDLGTTGLALMYGQYDDIDTTAQNSDQLKRMGLLVEQSLSDYGTSIYGGYERFEYDTNAANFSDVDGVFVGMKVVF